MTIQDQKNRGNSMLLQIKILEAQSERYRKAIRFHLAELRRKYHHLENGGSLGPDSVAILIESLERVLDDPKSAINSPPTFGIGPSDPCALPRKPSDV